MKKFWKFAGLGILLVAVFASFAACKSNDETVSVDGVSLDTYEKTLVVGDTYQLTATVSPQKAENKSVSWSSDNETAATVSDGLVTALSIGTATITVTTTDGNKTAECIVTVVNDGKSKDRAIPLDVDVTYTAIIGDDCDTYDDMFGRWYSFTPSSTDTFVIKSKESSNQTDVYLFDSESGESIAEMDYTIAYNSFRLEYSLTAETTYYFFVALQDVDNGIVTFEIFELLDVSELITALDTATGNLFLRCMIELVDTMVYGDPVVYKVLTNIEVDELAVAAENGSFDAVNILEYMQYFYDNEYVEPALLELNPDAIFTIAASGSQVAQEALMTLIRYGNAAAKDAIELLELNALIELAEDGDSQSLDLLFEMAKHDSSAAVNAIAELDVAQWVSLIESGDDSYAHYIPQIAMHGNEAAQTALKTTSVTVWTELAESGDNNAVVTLIGLLNYGFEQARDSLKTLDVTELAKLAESGNADARGALFRLRFICEDAVTVCETMEVEAWVGLAGSDLFEATMGLDHLARSGNTAAINALKDIDITAALEESTIVKYNILIYAATYGNEQAFNVLVNEADNENRNPPYQTLAILVNYKAIFAEAALSKLIEGANAGKIYAYHNIMDTLTDPDIIKDTIKKIDMTIYKNRHSAYMEAENFIQAGVTSSTIFSFANFGNADAIDFLQEIDITPYEAMLEQEVETNEYGKALNILIVLAIAGNSDAKTVLENHNFDAFADYYETNDFDQACNLFMGLARAGVVDVCSYLKEYAENGEFLPLEKLTRMVDKYDIEVAADTLRDLDATALIAFIENPSSFYLSGDYEDELTSDYEDYFTNDYEDKFTLLMKLADNGNSAALDALKNFDPMPMLLYENYSAFWIEVTNRLSEKGNVHAANIMKSMEIVQFVGGAEGGYIVSANALIMLAKQGNAKAVEAVKTLDVTILIAKNETNSEDTTEVLTQLAELGNTAAQEYINGLEQ